MVPYDYHARIMSLNSAHLVPELQGTTQEVAIAKCRVAAEKVRQRFFLKVVELPSHI